VTSDTETFDFVVIGAGPAGCVSASRLTEDPGVSATLIEAGPDRRGFLNDCTAAGAAINTLNHVRGHRFDYDAWAGGGNPGWRFDEVLPYLICSENNQRFRGGFHGNDGPT
jgi:choline dehydrogenase-like flavoprotein